MMALHKSCNDFEEELKQREDQIVELGDQYDALLKVARQMYRFLAGYGHLTDRHDEGFPCTPTCKGKKAMLALDALVKP